LNVVVSSAWLGVQGKTSYTGNQKAAAPAGKKRVNHAFSLTWISLYFGRRRF
jgi:hypothetical protein